VGTERTGASLLYPAEANALCAALASHVSADLGIRVLLVKGLALVGRGLRGPHPSSDTDFIIEPGQADTALRALGEARWKRRDMSCAGARASRHSTTLTRDDWPTDLDMHAGFPGLLTHKDDSFERLWERREPLTVAGCTVWVPDRASSIVIWALHSLRGTVTQARHAEELRRIREVVLPELSEAERHELADRIVELGADEPLRVVPEFAEIIGDRHGTLTPGALEEWRAKVAQAQEATPWLQVLREARWSERPWLFFRAVWPSAHDLRLIDEALVDSPFGRVQSRGRRAWRLVQRVAHRRRQGR